MKNIEYELLKILINKNINKEFVIHITNKIEFKALLEILTENKYEYTIPFDTLENIMTSFMKENKYNGCFRISKTRGIAYNQSVEYWKNYYKDIVEIINGEIVFC